MKRSIFIVAVALALTFVMVLLWWWMSQREFKPEPTLARPAETVRSDVSATPSATIPTHEERRLKLEERAKAINTAIEGGNVAINFFGKVIDQDGKPIADAAISYNYSTEHGNLLGVAWSASKVHKASTTSNGAGLFSIQGLKGSCLTIESLQKDGYQYNPRRANTYDYYGSSAAGKFTPDASSPVLFLMLNKTTAEPLISYGGTFGVVIEVPGDGTPVRWNLWKGQRDPSGELQITFKREPAVLARVGPPTSWSAKIEVVGGGIVEADPGELLHQAPGAGYAPTVDYPKAEQKRGVSARSFYIKTADGKYGRLQLHLYPGDDGPAARCLIKASMNPSGLRNLEPVNSEQAR